jgi:hypothetical protein
MRELEDMQPNTGLDKFAENVAQRVPKQDCT